MDIKFDIEKLNRTDRKIFDAMTESERQSFVRTWIQLETQKAKLVQQKNASRERAAREKRVLAEKERKERTHRLIERGALLEAYLGDPLEFSNTEIKEILNRTLGTEYTRRVIESFRSRHM